MRQRHEHMHQNDRGHQHADDRSCDTSDADSPYSATDAVNHGGAVRHSFKVEGLDCAEEVAVLKREVGPLVGGEEHLAFDILNGRMKVLRNSQPVSSQDVRSAVARTGMKAVDWRPGQKRSPVDDRRRLLQVWFTFLSGLGVFSGLFLHVWLAGGVWEAIRLFGGHGGQAIPWPEVASYTVAIVFGLRFVLPKAWFAARRFRPDMNLLMVIAVVGAVGIGEYFEAATVTFLFALSLMLESWSVGRARRAVSALLDLAPATVRIRAGGGEETEILAAEARVGARFIVKPGERIPLDGRIVLGATSVDQSPITGESVPVEKNAGDDVFAGTINGDGALEVESTKGADDTTLARIIRMVEEAQGRRAHVEQWVERFAAIYTPAIIVLAIGIFLVPPLAFGAGWGDWFYRALVLLVIACPCALVISTPVSIVAALAASARQGVLVKGGVFIERPARLRALAFDKTGTLTEGKPKVVRVIPLNGHTEAELIERAAALEAFSTHPLAHAVSAFAKERGIQPRPASDVQMLRGKGVIGGFGGEPFWLGSHRYLVERGQDSPEIAAQAATLERDGTTVVAIGNDRHVCGLLAISDTVRPTAEATIRALRAGGVEHLVMLTGDNRVTANAIADAIGIDEVHAELLPEDKVVAVERLVEAYGEVAMVGDGVNDAPAMARASFGVAMGAAGSDAAIETADIALMTDDLEKLPWLIGHSRRTLAVIHQNIALSLGVKAAFAILTFAGIATLWGAIAADVGVSLLVVGNALRLLRTARTGTNGTGQPIDASAAVHSH
ncbi:MAG: heavy metal translocating P-type ATPase [Alphaproteobacteria bacterium]